MFGIRSNINEGMLYLLNDIVEEELESLKYQLGETSQSKSGEIDQLKFKISLYEAEIERFKSEIEEQLKNNFQFSVEELYSMYGQYDNKYLSIEFHKYSDAATKYGRNVSGVIVYSKSEREQLENTINQSTIPRTRGIVKLDSNDKSLTDNQKTQILNEGFDAGDIYQILTSKFNYTKSYNQLGIKEIPNTINIDFDPSDVDSNRITLWLYSERIKSGGQLITEEWDEFCGLSICYEPNSKDINLIKDKIYDENGALKKSIRFFELKTKLHLLKADYDEIMEFDSMLKELKSERVGQIRKELKRSTNKTLEAFEQEYPDIYEAINDSIYGFKVETLEYYNSFLPIYWDYESYLHIYLRHCEELEIEGHFERKTNFQYSLKDIARILKIAIENLLPQINERLSQGKEFRIYGNKALYFNGNHYSLHILPNGRVAAFHPMENPEE